MRSCSDPSHVLVVEDAVNGLLSGRAAGAKTVRVPEGYRSVNAEGDVLRYCAIHALNQPFNHFPPHLQ